ncbi:MmcB family DNA repair protein [Aquamicrobium defluvii]|uniref:MmcB family DNA repair protein n=1 Tax=Aquamicrobium defluvii TaxID=69279 RepID=A0A011UUN0_9HYPH|nr:MmcB family DNA repair protein [Aquamicrobium defluvii]EXL09588.1 hypothetical protein BG36_20945 [Aquamicrobium defluvii]EZQ16379.1 hypothetical protein CF98_40780 [Halopseudomonas bauzanensis]
MTWEHDALAADLKAHLSANTRERLIWCDMQLGPAGSPRPDVYVLPKSYSKFTPTAYEIKISRSDFQADVNAGKWQKYYAFASAVIFAVPDGLIKTTELPGGAGLIVRKANVWRLAKAPKVNALDNLPREAWMKLVMDGLSRLDAARPALNTYVMRERAYKAALGDEIAKLAANREHAKWRIQNEIDQHEKRLEAIRQGNETARRHADERNQIAAREYDRLCDMLDLPRGTPTWRIPEEIEQRVKALDADQRVRDLVQVIDAAQNSLAAAKLRVAASAKSEAA